MPEHMKVSTGSAFSVQQASVIAEVGMQIGKGAETNSVIPQGRTVATSHTTGTVEIRYAPNKPKQQGNADTASY